MDKTQKKRISLRELYKKFVPNISNEQLAVIVAIFIGILTIGYFIYALRRRGSRTAVLLMGLCEAGKTQLFSRLCYDTDALSVTSIKESVGQLDLGKRKVPVYDLPGHERIRYMTFDKVKSMARAIVFVVDATTVHKEIRDAAEFLYTVLCDQSVQSGCRKLLIVCNKKDVAVAKSAQAIRSFLEKEMNLLRKTQTSQLQSVSGGEAATKKLQIGKTGEDFSFSDLGFTKVDFVEASSKGEEANLNDITNWIAAAA